MDRVKNMKKFRELLAQMVVRLFAAVLLIGLSSCGLSGGKPLIADGTGRKGSPSRDLYERVNHYRAWKGLGTLEWSGELAGRAQIHAESMSASRKLSHDGLAARAADLRRRGVVRRVTENVAYGGGVIEDPALMTLEDWINSERHRQNLLAAEDTVTGVGFSMTADGYFYVVQLYGR